VGVAAGDPDVAVTKHLLDDRQRAPGLEHDADRQEEQLGLRVGAGVPGAPPNVCPVGVACVETALKTSGCTPPRLNLPMKEGSFRKRGEEP
jgi:hypothetical protein